VNGQSLLDELRALELEVHHPGRCTSRDRLDELLHPDFHEVGRSGSPYDRERTIGLLLNRADPLPVASGGFKLELLASDTALLTFGTALIQADGSLAHHTLRASLWMRHGATWQLRYHQGTPSQTTWH
jgi:hypothetical protein